MDTPTEELQEDKLSEVCIDLTTARSGELSESFLGMFGYGIKMILRRMFGGDSVPVRVKGTKSDIAAFTSVLGKEKRYLDTWSKYGLDNPRTYKNKAQLQSSVKKFERKTGLKWPFK
tara:strand:+ start:161 stop:511 length:351 start_codon:yes stop_codon:yes gene_type:complete